MKQLLDKLRIENYRTFRSLEIERLGRATLIVGRNNSGKSTVLEAVRLYASRGDGDVIWSILESHDEVGPVESPEDRLLSVKQLFHGRDAEWNSWIRIGTSTDEVTIRLTPPTENPSLPTGTYSPAAGDGGRPFLFIASGGGFRALPLDVDWRRSSRAASNRDLETEHAYVSPHGLTNERSAKQWDLIALTDLEEDVIAALRIIMPEIERISFISEARGNRVPVAKLRSHTKPVPLRSLGDGVNRMLGIALSLVSARGGVLLLDEVENGIHFTAQARLWELIFQSANRLNVQVFATTHSWDCIQAFQRAASQDRREEAALVRLDLRRDVVEPTTFSERDLSIVTRDQIEVR